MPALPAAITNYLGSIWGKSWLTSSCYGTQWHSEPGIEVELIGTGWKPPTTSRIGHSGWNFIEGLIVW